VVTLSQCQSISLEAHDSDPYDTEAGQREEGALHPSPELLPLDVLLQEAHQEISRFRGKQKTSNVAAFEVFRRALFLRDDEAWVSLYRLYAPLVEAWILLRRQGLVIQAHELEGLVNETFAKFACAIDAQRWQQFPETRHLLAYLKCCAVTVAADAWRQQQRRSREASLDAIDLEQSPLLEDPVEAVINHLVLHDLWQAAGGVVACEQERLILEQHYALGVPLRELQSRYPQLFPTIDGVYGIKRNLLQRLRRSRAVQEAVGLGEAHSGRLRPTKKRDAYRKGTT
jgi:DNA-directed RNA polymerase specialized sigma24 family protein